MAKIKVAKILLAMPALLACTGMLQALPVSPITATPSAVGLAYTKSSSATGTPGASTNVVVSVPMATGATVQFFTVDVSTIPIWLTVGTLSGTAPVLPTAGISVNFVANDVSNTLSAGSYSGSVHFKVTGYPDLTVAVTLINKNPTAALSVLQGNTLTANWSLGNTTLPTFKLTSSSSGDPISFTAAAVVTAPTSPAAWMKLDHNSGVAYSFGGTVINVSFSPPVFSVVNVGDHMTGTVTLTPTTGSPVAVSIDVTVTPPSATINLIVPAVTAATPGAPIKVILEGVNFVAAPSGQKTVVTVAIDSGSPVTLDTSVVNVVNASTIILTLDDTVYLSLSQTLTITAANTSGTVGAGTMKVTTNPIISSIVNAASYVQPATPSTAPNLAPYELISIFGDNFGPLVTDPPVVSVVDANSRYSNTLVSNTNNITVSFFQSDGTTLIANAYLLLATKNQINAIVPAAFVASMKVVVTYNSNASDPYAVNGVAADPGIFTTASSGQGQAAVINVDGSVNGPTTKASKGSVISIYLTGLGAPNSVATNTAAPTAVYPASCMSLASYWASMNTVQSPTVAWTSDDGAVLLSSLINTNFAPCFTAVSPAAVNTLGNVSVTINGVASNVTYAGFVKDSLAGLYQINATVPSTAGVPALSGSIPAGTVPLVVAVGSGTATVKSPVGVTMLIQ